MATLSLLGLYNYDDSILDTLQLPNEVNRETLIYNLLMQTAELEIIYTDTEFIKEAIKYWSLKELPTWEKMLELFQAEYNPIWNVDAKESETITRELNRDTTNDRNTKENVKTNSTLDGTTTEQVTGFNSGDFQNANKTIEDTETNSTADSTGSVKDKGNLKDLETITNIKNRGGNIGVTMTQDMIKKEMEVRPMMNITNYIIERFIDRFCLAIY